MAVLLYQMRYGYWRIEMDQKNIIKISNYLSYRWQKRVGVLRVLLMVFSIVLAVLVSVRLGVKKEQKQKILLYQTYLEAAQKAETVEDYYEAEVNYRKMLALVPGDARAYDGITFALEATRNYEAALEIRKEQFAITHDEEVQKEAERLTELWSGLQQSAFEAQ